MKNKNFWLYGIITFLILFMASAVIFRIYQIEILPSQFYGALISVVITVIITYLLLNCQTAQQVEILKNQTEQEVQKDKDIKIFQQKITVYAEFTEKMWAMLDDGTVTDEELKELRTICFRKLVFYLNSEQINKIYEQINKIDFENDDTAMKAVGEITHILQNSLNTDENVKSSDLIKLFNSFDKKKFEEKESLIDEIKSRFEKIYKSISSIEYNINEDDVLVYTLRVHFNSLWESNAIEKINKLLSEENSISFIKDFTRSLAISFEHLTSFFGKDQRENLEIHSLISLGGIGISIPFIIKAYKFGLSKNDISQLCSSLESLVVRHRLIGTRADITSRLNDVYQKFKEDNSTIKPIIERIEWMKNVGSDSWWWAYWNNREFERALQGGVNHSTAKFLLWKYENHLESQGKSGYAPTRFDKITSPELEHIAPQTENPETGYDTYDDEFIHQHINCLGNYLLLSKSHNCSVGNKPFADKRASYTHLEQQREIQEMTIENPTWTRDLIQKRKEKIVQFLMTNL